MDRMKCKQCNRTMTRCECHRPSGKTQRKVDPRNTTKRIEMLRKHPEWDK